MSEIMRKLISVAKRQNRRPSIVVMLRSEAWVLLGRLVRHRPPRWLWQARVTWLLHLKWSPRDTYSLHENWEYAKGIAEYLDEAGDGYLSPSEAIEMDREYWEDL